jgi:oligosaccharide repeat unit polymerase
VYRPLSDSLSVSFSSDFLIGIIVVVFTLIMTGVIVLYNFHLFNLMTFRIPGFFVLAYIIMILLPLPFVYASHENSWASDTFLFAVPTAFLLTIIGIIVTNRLIPVSSKKLNRWLSVAIPIKANIKFFSVVLLVLCLILLDFYIRVVGTLPIIHAVSGGKSLIELSLARENALKNLPKYIAYTATLLRGFLFPYTTLLLFILWRKSKNYWWIILFSVSFLGNLVMAVATLEKSPFAAFLIMLGLTELLLKKEKFTTKKIIPIIIIGFSFPVFVIFSANQFNIQITDLLGQIFKRLFFIPTDVLFYYFDYIPYQEDFLLGRTLPFINKLFPEGYLNISNAICVYAVPGVINRTCSFNAAYPGALWADFGWLGIVIGSFLCGIIIQIIQWLIATLPKSPPTVVSQAMIIYQITTLCSTSISAFLISGVVYQIMLTIFLLFGSDSMNKNNTIYNRTSNNSFTL